MSRFEIEATKLSGLRVVRRHSIGDSRGSFERVFCVEDLADILEGRTIQQVNRTLTAHAGTVRGMHFQRAPHAEMKFVSCLRGEIFDVAVDLRAGSRTFLEWHGEVLSAGNQRALSIPEGFAHGFQTLCDDCELLYFHTAAYCSASEGGVNADDPRLGIEWPRPFMDRSDRDAGHPAISDDFEGIDS